MKTISTNSWDDDLKRQIITEEDQILFKEAIKCLKSECYRAGYVVAWLSIMESLKSKISQLSQTEKQAEISYKKLENEEKAYRSIDKTIITESKVCNLIDDTEHSKLIFLWGERCKFAHPYQVEPNLDELKYIINQAVAITLGKPLMYRKNFINEFVETISFQLHYFPRSNSEISRIASNIFSRVPDDLHPYFLKTLFVKLGEIIADALKKNFETRFQLIIKDLMLYNKDNLADKKWGLESIAINHPYSIVKVIHKDTWPHLPERIKDILVEFLITTEVNEQVENGLYSLKRLNDLMLLDQSHKQRFYKLLNSKDLDYSYAYYSYDDQFYELIIAALKSNSFAENNTAISILENSVGLEFIKSLIPEKRVELGQWIMLDAACSNFKSQNYVRNYVHGDAELLEGMLRQCFINFNNQFQYRNNYLSNVLSKIDELEEQRVKDIFTRLIQSIESLSGRKVYLQDFIEDVINLTNKFSSNMNEQLKRIQLILT